MADNDSKIVLWLRQKDPEWGKLSYPAALSKWLRYQTSGSPEVENYIFQVKQAYAGYAPEKRPAGATRTWVAPPVEEEKGAPYLRAFGAKAEFPQPEGAKPIQPTGFGALDIYSEAKTGRSWWIMIPDLQYVDMLTPQMAQYAYENVMLWDELTGERRLMTMPEKVEAKLDSRTLYDQMAYQALSNELIQGGVSEEDLTIPVVQQWVQEQMGNVRVGKGVDYAKESEWIKQVSAYNKMTTEAEAAWKIEQATPPSAKPWYKPPEPWQPLVQKAINRPERMTSL